MAKVSIDEDVLGDVLSIMDQVIQQDVDMPVGWGEIRREILTALDDDETFSDLDEMQAYAETLVSRIWPDESIEEATLALCEEAGEVARAVIKRNHAEQGSGDRAPRDWSMELQKELAQVVVVAMKIAEREGFSLWSATNEELHRLEERLAKIQGDD